MRKVGLFDVSIKLSKIDQNSDPLKQLNEVANWKLCDLFGRKSGRRRESLIKEVSLSM